MHQGCHPSARPSHCPAAAPDLAPVPFSWRQRARQGDPPAMTICHGDPSSMSSSAMSPIASPSRCPGWPELPGEGIQTYRHQPFHLHPASFSPRCNRLLCPCVAGARRPCCAKSERRQNTQCVNSGWRLKSRPRKILHSLKAARVRGSLHLGKCASSSSTKLGHEGHRHADATTSHRVGTDLFRDEALHRPSRQLQLERAQRGTELGAQS